jgi:L-lactate dehydrogenase complex protein LldG
MSEDNAAKSSIMRAIRAALKSTPEAASIPRDYAQRDERARSEIIEEFVERLEHYKAHVDRADSAALPSAIADACERYGVQRLVTPVDTPDLWLPVGAEVLRDAPALSNLALDGCDAVLTGCALAIAQTGTLVLDGGARQGRRALSLIPDQHICVVFEDQVVGIVPEGIAQLAPTSVRPITFISGPSATSDIELSRVEGVHGPRTLHVILVSAVAES